MVHDVRQWPSSVYPGEVDDECPEARQIIDALILNLARHGPSPDGYGVKTLGKKTGRSMADQSEIREAASAGALRALRTADCAVSHS